jgi:hypothetical protein
MARSTNSLDRRRGSLPGISKEGDSIVFEMAVMSDHLIPPGARLMVRCDQFGNVLARIVNESGASKDF